MRYDWTPLWRSTIGFDRLFDALDEVQRTAEETYPPYNIERFDDNRFQISVALAGFTPEESDRMMELLRRARQNLSAHTVESGDDVAGAAE